MEHKLSSDDVWYQALVDNTAQGIYHRLKELESISQFYQRQWIWELLQNALDSAPQDGEVNVEVELLGQQLSFRHNGSAFAEDEIAHLIYHGSTKERESGKIGKFGTGFLTTHLVSKMVRVTGIMKSNENFSFTLDRNGESAEDIRQRMEDSKKQFQDSYGSGTAPKPKEGFTTEYTYRLAGDNACKIAEIGIEDLTKIAPYVLALNDEISSVAIINRSEKSKFMKSLVDNVTNDILIVHVEHKHNNTPDSTINLVVAKDKNLSVAVTVVKHDEDYQIASNQNIPKLFIAFPLEGTEGFSFPAIVNCRDFEPTEHRDGIFLGSAETGPNVQNKSYLNKAVLLLHKLLDYALSQQWANVDLLTQVTVPTEKNWLDTEWYKCLLKKLITNKFMGTELIQSQAGWIAPKDAHIPFPAMYDGFWDLASYLYQDKLPAKELWLSWANIIDGWAKLLDKNPEELEQSLTIEKFGQTINDIGSLEKLGDKLRNEDGGITPILWLNKFTQFLFLTNKGQLLDTLNLLPNQDGVFRKRTDLMSDGGIDGTLKDIARDLGKNVRANLLHLDMIKEAKDLLTPKSQDDVLSHVLKIIKEEAEANTYNETFAKANLALFAWLVSNQKYESVSGYPVLCRKIDEEGGESITFLGGREQVLAPVERWPEGSRSFVAIFPQEFIISSKYSDRVEAGAWDALQGRNLVTCEPLYFSWETIGGSELMDSLGFGESLNEEEDHEITNVRVSNIAFLRLDNKGIIDQVRSSKERARAFIRFLLNFAVFYDDSVIEPRKLSCKCGKEHSVYTSDWLRVLKTRSWVPIRKGKQEIPSAQNLAALIQDQHDILRKISEDKPSKFINNLNVSVSDIVKNAIAKDERVKFELDKAAGMLYEKFGENPQQLTSLARLVRDEPNFIQEFQERIAKREKVRRNQLIGAAVESIFRGIFEEEELRGEGFKIERTGVGSDYAIEYDLIDNDEEQLLKIEKGKKRVLIELKSTSEDYARMTTTQGRRAVDSQENYLLCVVNLAGSEISEVVIKQNSRFVPDIGQRLTDKVNRVDELQEKTTEVTSGGDEVKIEVSEGQVHFRISKPVWERGLDFNGLLNYLRSKL